MSLLEKTRHYQSALAGYCRTGDYSFIPGVKEQHVVQYRRLVFNVVDDTLQSAYPLTFELLTQKEWKSLVEEFFGQHACVSAQVWYMPKELYDYIARKGHPLTEKYPFLLELLWFEWLEVELYMMEDEKVDFKEKGDLFRDRLVLNPESHIQHFTFPVHLKNAKHISRTDQGNYFLVLHRHPETGSISFMDLSPAFVRMLELLGEGPKSIPKVLELTCEELQIPIAKAVEDATMAFFERAWENKLILGFK